MSEKKHIKEKKLRRRERYHRSSLRKFSIPFFLFLGLIGAINLLLNQKIYQEKIAEKIYKDYKIKLDFEELYLNLFTGTVAGKDLSVTSEKTNFHINLSEFEIEYSTLRLFIAQLYVTSINADHVFIDIAELKQQPKKRRNIPLPIFLARTQLTGAQINTLFVNRGAKGFTSIENIRLQSKGNYLTNLANSPLVLKANRFRNLTPKVHTFADNLQLNGYFRVDVTNPQFIDQSSLRGEAQVRDFLMAFNRKPKPWLNRQGWDKDLEPILKKYYPLPLPTNKTFLYLQQIDFQVAKNKTDFYVDTFRVKLDEASLLGAGGWSQKTKDLHFRLLTSGDLEISKLPLGKSRFRTAYDTLNLNIETRGKFTNLQNNDIFVTLNGALKGNLVNKESGDLNVKVKGRLQNSILNATQIEAKLANGQIQGKGQLDIPNLTAKAQYTCQTFDIQTFLGLFANLKIPSLANCQGTLAGKLTNPTFDVDISTDDARYQFLHFGKAKGKLTIKDQNLDLRVATAGSEIGSGKLDMTLKNVFKPNEHVLDMKTSFENVDVRKLLESKSLDGVLAGTFNLKRKNRKNTGDGKATVKKFAIQEREYGTISAPYTLNGNRFVIKPIQMQLYDPVVLATSPKGLTFDFDDLGYRFEGEALPQLKVQGTYKSAQKESLDLKLNAENLSFLIFRPFLPFEADTSTLSGNFQGRYHIPDPFASQFQGTMTRLNLITPEGKLLITTPAKLSYNKRTLSTPKLVLNQGLGELLVSGSMGLDKTTNLKLKGLVDFNVLSDLNPFISYSEKPIKIDLLLKGNILAPNVYGTAELDDDSIEFRKAGSDLEELTGTLKFDGNRVSTKEFKLLYDDAPMEVSGWITHNYNVITASDLTLKGKEVPVHMENGIDLLADMDLAIKGRNRIMIRGNMNIVEGSYSRDFGINNFVIKPKEQLEEQDESRWAMLPITTGMDIAIKNTGEFNVKNNLADLELKIDLDLLGTLKTPLLSGQIDFLNGKIHAVGIFFEEAEGYAQFRKDPTINPEINLRAKTEVQEYVIYARADGKMENLRFLLDSNPTLDRKDIISLLFYGQTSDQLVAGSREEFLQTAAISQLASVLQRPIEQASGIDVFSVSTRQETSQEYIQRLAVGKSLTKRLNLAFTTDLNEEDPERAIEVEFQIFDVFSIITAKDFGDRYRFDLNLRFESF